MILATHERNATCIDFALLLILLEIFSSNSMSELTEMTEVQTKRDFVLSIAQNRGWVEPRIRERTDRDTLILLRTIARIREELGETVAMYT